MRPLPLELPFVITIWHACVPQCWNVSWKVCGAPAWRVYCFGPKAGVMSAKPAGGNITATNANASTSTIILPDIFLSFCLQLRSSLLGPSGRGGTTRGPHHTISAGGSARKTRTGPGFRSANFPGVLSVRVAEVLCHSQERGNLRAAQELISKTYRERGRPGYAMRYVSNSGIYFCQ